MKNIIVFFIVGMMSYNVLANPIIPQIKDDENGTKVSLFIPGFLIKIAGSSMAHEDETARYFLKKSRGINILVREGAYYQERFDKKYRRISRKMERQAFVPLMTVYDSEAKVNISAKVNKKNMVKQLVVMVDEADTFVLLSIKGKYKLSKIMEMASEGDFATVLKD